MLIADLIRLQREADAAYRAIQLCDDLSDEAVREACDAYQAARRRREAAVLREQRP